VVLLGGDGKGQDFAPLRGPVQRSARAVALIGRDAALIQAVLTDTGVPMQHHATLPEAVTLAKAAAFPGDVVLFSPGTSSFDMFKNYADRGNQFRTLVAQLSN
jgi:UDP-N-acetylmuramoylalanine--D-glutamate ligase